ncbi:MAG: helix-turn-helix domain-containing protein [Spirochaetes bacterium]|nr:helix-turn-helix domain-containing protein [Spirochaetota bacterium]
MGVGDGLRAPSSGEESPWKLLLSGSKVRVLSCRTHQADKHWHPAPRTLENHFLLYTLSGRYAARVGGKTVAGGPGTFLLISPGQTHRLGPGAPGALPRNVAVHFQVSDALGIPARQLFPKPVWVAPEPSAWGSRLRALESLMDQRHAIADQMGELLLRSLFIDLRAAGHRLAFGSSCGDPRIARSLAHLHAQPGRTPTVGELAREARLGELQFRRLFVKELGATPKEFLDRLRLGAAAELLLKTGLRVKEIAHRAGFPDEHHFQKRFKRVYGSTPGDFRLRPWD